MRVCHGEHLEGKNLNIVLKSSLVSLKEYFLAQSLVMFLAELSEGYFLLSLTCWC